MCKCSTSSGSRTKRSKVTAWWFDISNAAVDLRALRRVGSNPVMHGCPPNFFIQAVNRMGPGPTESLDCVSLQTANNVALTYSSMYQDGSSPPTASVSTYNISPNMHVCKPNFAMIGIHQAQNNLFCAD